jgi:hypothetical protein
MIAQCCCAAPGKPARLECYAAGQLHVAVAAAESRAAVMAERDASSALDMDINTPDTTICSICKYISQVISTTNIVIYSIPNNKGRKVFVVRSSNTF